MIALSFIIVTLFLASWSLAITYRAQTRAWRYSWHRVWIGLSLAAFIYCYGAWVFISVYARYAFAIAEIAILLTGLFRKKILARDQPGWKKAANIPVALLLNVLAILFYTGTTGRPPSLSLHAPFRRGTYAVQQGGKGLPANLFHVSARNAIYAMDWVKLNRWGNRANTFFSAVLTDYNIFGDTVLCPCSGHILRIVDDNPDNIPPFRKRGPHNLNSVVIESAGYYIFMGHFKEGSAMVAAGDSVQAGQPVALAGNSGMSLEPHLHIQAHRKVNDGPWYTQPPVQILFEGKEYWPSDVMRVR